MKIVINKCFGGFRLSDAAYEKLIEYGIPSRAYTEQVRDPDSGLYLPEPKNEGEVIFDNTLTDGKRMFGERYWDCWTRESRTHPLIVRVVEELGKAANGMCADLRVIEIPYGVAYEINEYDGMERVDELRRSWG